LALIAATQIINSFSYRGGYQTLLVGAFVFAAINIIVKPLVRILFLPLNILTLGLFAFVINALMLYLLTIILPDFMVAPYFFPGFREAGVTLPPIRFSLMFTFFLVSIVISTITSFLNWLTSK
jgi:uncharacterized membrane protein YvlD (DUF360 family)